MTRFTIKLPDSASIPIGNPGINISPDGKFLSYLLQSGAGQRLFLRATDREALEPVLGAEFTAGDVVYSVFSPDSKWVVFNLGNTIKKSSVFGGASVDICIMGALARGIWWGADRNIYFGQINGGIYRVSESGGTAALVTSLDTASGEISHRFPELLPDGRSILYTIKFNNISSFDEAAIAVLDTKSGASKVLVRGGTSARFVPTGHLVYARGSFISAVPFDLDKLEVAGSPRELFRGGWMNPFSGDVNLAFSDDGTLVYVPRGIESYTVSRIKWIDARGQETPLVDTTNSYFLASISPDGEKLALHVQAANDNIWLYHVGRKSLTRLTFGGGNSGFPVWSADGRFIIYESERRNGSNLYEKPWDGSGKEELLATSEKFMVPRSVTPDGKTLALIQDGDIWLLALDGSKRSSPFFKSHSTEGNPVFSPDGHYLAYETNESGRPEVVIVPYPSRAGKWQISSGGGSNPIWSPSGKEIYFSQGTSLFSVDIHPGTTFDYSAPKKFLDLPPDCAGLTGISMDGTKFAMITIPYKDLNMSEYTLVTNWFQELKSAFAGK